MVKSRKRQRPRRSGRKQVRSVIRRIEDPRFYSIGPHPSSPSPTPWYPFVIKAKVTKDSTFTVADVVNYITTYWIPTQGTCTKVLPSMGFRFLNVRAWCRTNNDAFIMGTFPFLNNLTWQSSTPSSVKPMWNKTCYPALNQYARIGFRWPKSHQECVFYDDSVEHRKVPIVFIKPENTSAFDVLLYIYIMWTFNESAGFTQPITLEDARLKDWILLEQKGAKDLSLLNINAMT